MKKKVIVRSLLGFPIGIAIGYLITVFSSLIWANGYYSPCAPEFIAAMGSEINAVLLQTILWGIVGTGFAASSFIWQIENWSIVKQTGLYFFIISLIMMPIAYFAHWLEQSVVGFLTYFGIFLLIFAIIWLTLYMIGKNNVRKMNEKLPQAKNGSNK